MGALDTIDPMIRGGATALFLLWIAILWRDHRAVPAARVAIAMNAGAALVYSARTLDCFEQMTAPVPAAAE